MHFPQITLNLPTFRPANLRQVYPAQWEKLNEKISLEHFTKELNERGSTRDLNEGTQQEGSIRVNEWIQWAGDGEGQLLLRKKRLPFRPTILGEQDAGQGLRKGFGRPSVPRHAHSESYCESFPKGAHRLSCSDDSLTDCTVPPTTVLRKFLKFQIAKCLHFQTFFSTDWTSKRWSLRLAKMTLARWLREKIVGDSLRRSVRACNSDAGMINAQHHFASPFNGQIPSHVEESV